MAALCILQSIMRHSVENMRQNIRQNIRQYAAKMGIAVFFVLSSSSCSTLSTGEVPDAKVGTPQSKGPVGRTMKTHSEKFAACARDAVTVQTGSIQKIVLGFQIDAEGRVTRAKIKSMSMGDPDLHDCVLRRLRKITFPKPADGQTKSIEWPLTLSPS